uniref:PIG-L family deacetylase n=1 Tax=Flavobacterium sp. TaxID=239 RepID=UPI0040470772
MKLDILAFGAHPDDVELGCSGTIANEISLGKKVGIIDLTRGELGTRGSVEISKSPLRILVKAIFFPSGETTASAS